jgi:hypothetical protein
MGTDTGTRKAEAGEDTRTRVDPSELAHPTRPLELEDFASFETDKDDEGAKNSEQVLRDYFHRFAAPVTDPTNPERQVCPACGEFFGGLMANLGLGVGIEWGLVHGEGNCSYCRWPYRGHHFIYAPENIDEDGRKKEGAEPILTIHNMFVAYLPEFISGWKRPKPKESPYG